MADNKIFKIALGAGHGLYTAGKRCMKSLDPKETREWWLNDRIVDKLERKLANYRCEVLRVDDTTGLTDVSLANRVKKANNWGADVYISTHHNAGILGKLRGYLGKPAGGTVVYYYSSKAERKTQAQVLYNEIVDLTGLIGDRANPVLKHGFYVIKKTNMSAFLIENGFMDSPTDVPIILSEEHAEKTAQGILNFLVKEFKLEKIKEEVTELFKVRVTDDSLNYRSGPGTECELKGTITDHGLYTIVEVAKAKDGGTWGRLKSGAGWINISSKYVSRV